MGWDGVVSQILDSATDAESTHHMLDDVFGEGSGSSTRYFRFNPVIGPPESFPIDEVDPERLQDLCDIVDYYMESDEQQAELKELRRVVHSRRSMLSRVLRR